MTTTNHIVLKESPLVKEVMPEYIPFKCPVCNGYGTIGYAKIACPSCGGYGFIKVPPKEENDK